MEKIKFDTSVVNLQALQSYSFVIPAYQRPYVWGEEQIKKLLVDFYQSYKHRPYEDYYIGTILTKEDENKNEAELIDGQQRFTTLWLTALVFSQMGINSKLGSFLKNEGHSLKIKFAIRTEVEDYFTGLLDPDKKEMDSKVIDQYPYLENIAKALVHIRAIIDPLEEDKLSGFGEYLYTNIKMIKNTTPEKIDLNKLFSTINSAGAQLEQTDILKANLLRRIDNKVVFGKIWEACENMSSFFEKNMRDVFPKTDWTKVDLISLQKFDASLFLYENTNIASSSESDMQKFTIEDWVKDHSITYEDIIEINKDTDDRESEEVFCRSIINFGQLLLHTYRLYLKIENKKDFEGSFHVNRLIEIFKPLVDAKDQQEIERFFVLLWKVRFLFDNYVVKWISDVEHKTEELKLHNIREKDSTFSRESLEKSNMSMLQSVLYFTGDYLRQYWLTPYLYYLLNHQGDLDAKDGIHLQKLEQIDNSLSLCKILTDREATWLLLDQQIATSFDFESYLKSNRGTKFQHYWFQKLEYILWKSWNPEKTNEFKNYKIVSRNSVEHVYPQYPENQSKNPSIEDKYLHSFGNLVLLNVSQNSEYSNKSVDEKRSIFKNKNNTYDSLKSFYIFQNENWSSENIEAHQNEMIEQIKKHYNHAITY